MLCRTIAIKIITDFDGASPSSERGVIQHGDGDFEVCPSWRKAVGIGEEAIGGGSSFSIRVENTASSPRPFRCYINWQDTAGLRLKYHDVVYILLPDRSEWETVYGKLHQGGVNLELSLNPGITHIAASPWYGYTTACNYLHTKVKHSEVELLSIGRSEENRDIPALIIDNHIAAKSNVLVMARNHAYESAGSFCLEGMIDWLLTDTEITRKLKNQHRFHFLPMTNPDGVFNGMSRLTSPQGADINRCRVQNDEAWHSLKNYLDQVKPAFLLNVHNWMFKTEDGLLANEKSTAEKFRQLMPDQAQDGHVWRLEWTDLFLQTRNLKTCPPEFESWKDYTKKHYATLAITLEFPWFNRSTRRMREIGCQSLKTMLQLDKNNEK
jgi:hypothetical protein